MPLFFFTARTEQAELKSLEVRMLAAIDNSMQYLPHIRCVMADQAYALWRYTPLYVHSDINVTSLHLAELLVNIISKKISHE